VFVRDLGVTATVVAAPDPDGRVVLERGTWRIQSRADQCFAPDADAAPKAKPLRARTAVVVTPESEDVGAEIDLRGHEADEAVRRLETGLDRAVLGGVGLVRVIHGVGKGVLRAAVAEALRHHPHVATSRLGGHGEGGRGVTIVQLR
jgi:DNA mismatch repair protein MutS2